VTELFVYGTLRDAEYQRALFGCEVPARPATLSGWLAVVAENGYFTIVRAAGETVSGDLVTLDDEQLALADTWEASEDVVYERLRIEAHDVTGAIPAFVYVRPTESRERIEPGTLASKPRATVLAQIHTVRTCHPELVEGQPLSDRDRGGLSTSSG
jgi:gamma-glutamylcyclotransferase (GGCT)/AIG2-like uncharacterized protein YtfP